MSANNGLQPTRRECRECHGGNFDCAVGEIALAEGDGRAALSRFVEGSAPICPDCAWVNYARAYDTMGKADSTIFWYERYLAGVQAARRALRGQGRRRARDPAVHGLRDALEGRRSAVAARSGVCKGRHREAAGQDTLVVEDAPP